MSSILGHLTNLLQSSARRVDTAGMSELRNAHPGATRTSSIISCLLALLSAFALVGAIHVATAAARTTAHDAQQCDASAPAQRDQTNPLDLPQAPGANPLTGAQFFVPGPAKGSAAGAIAQLLGLDPTTMPIDESWATFAGKLAFGPLHQKLVADPSLARKVAQLSKIASQPEAQRISSFSWGGTPSGIFKQTQKILCDNMTADPGTIPIFNTYFLHPVLGGCPTPKQVSDYMPLFQRRIDAMAQAVGRHPAVFLLELDAIGSSSCVQKMGAMSEWEAALRYEMNAMQSLPHTVVYVEGGYADPTRWATPPGSSTRSASIRSGASSPTTRTRTGRAARLAGPPRSPSRPTGRTSSSNRRQWHRSTAQPQPSPQRQRGLVQPARSRPRAGRHDRHRLSVRRRMDVDAPAR